MGRRKIAIVAGVVVALVAASWIAVLIVLPSDEEFRKQAIAEVSRRFGIKVTIRSVYWRLLPVPAITVHNAKTVQKQPIEIRKVVVYPNLRQALRYRKFSVERLELDGGVIPTASLATLRSKEMATPNPYVAPVERVVFRHVTWISRTGVSLPIEGEIDFDPRWRPRHGEVRRVAFTPVARLTLEREGQRDRWKTLVALGGGTADGVLALATRRNGTLVLSGTLQPRGIEVATAADSLNRPSVVAGKANGHTVVSARGKTAADLGQSLRLWTEFKIAPATVLHFDLGKAIRTVGREHDGETTLESLTGVLDMQNTAEGTVLRYTELEAHAGSFTARGEATIFNRNIEGHGTLDLIKGVVGIPFSVTGSTRKPKAAVPPSALAGAAVGSILLPGLGTGIGARIGGAIGRAGRPQREPPGTPETEPTPLQKP